MEEAAFEAIRDQTDDVLEFQTIKGRIEKMTAAEWRAEPYRQKPVHQCIWYSIHS